ncbi:hypothetical protein NVP1039O_50 [Vibrio phage 1.039.O._10N.286.55.A2]|nr:hypothetical protein NVP1039O_50 [Vibrio phage 1.039.O._10N.286.55.A2]
MKPEIKEHLYGADQLQELIGLSRTQAWRIWNGHSKLTKQNEELLLIKLDLNKSARIKCEEAADNWIANNKQSLSGGCAISTKTVTSNSVKCHVSLINCDETMRYISELEEMIEIAKHSTTRDVLMDAYFEEVSNWVEMETEFFIKDYK